MEHTVDLRNRYLDLLASDVERNRGRFDPNTGRFLTGSGWAVTNQDIIYPLALLYHTPEHPYYRDDSILKLAIRGGDALRDFQNADGTVEFVKVDGSRWGPIYMPWSMYYWLETYLLLHDHLGEERAAAWREGLSLAYHGIARELETSPVHNIPVWNAAACCRAGEAFDVPDWTRAGTAMIERSIVSQHPSGFWPEHGGPTTSYNLVYIQALGLYHSFSGDASVIPCLERATDFQIRYTYPDGRLVETIDGRVKYHDRIPMTGHVGLQHTARGRRYVEFLLDRLDELRTGTPTAPDEESVSRSGSIRAAEAAYGLNPHIASSFVHTAPGPGTEIPQDRAEFAHDDPGIAHIRRSKGWYTCQGVFVCPPVESRWGQDRQSFLSVWADGYGLLVGGGNSKHQAEWSSFQLGSGDHAEWIPAEAAALPDGDAVRCIYSLAEKTIEMTVSHEDDGSLRVYWRGPEGATVRLPLKLHDGVSIATAEGKSVRVSASPLELSPEEIGDWVEITSIQITSIQITSTQITPIRIAVSTGFRLRWPSAPFNPYAKDGEAPLDESVGVIEIPLPGGECEAILTHRSEGRRASDACRVPPGYHERAHERTKRRIPPT